jgi:hypothetical protein
MTGSRYFRRQTDNVTIISQLRVVLLGAADARPFGRPTALNSISSGLQGVAKVLS